MHLYGGLVTDRLCIVMDASPLITAHKFGVRGRLVIDYILDRADVVVAPSVEYEVAELGRRDGRRHWMLTNAR